MTTTFTANKVIGEPAVGDSGWGTTVNTSLSQIDIAFGGAAPIHAARLGEKLGIAKVLIPASAGVGSAVGFLKAPFGYEVIRSAFMRVDTVDMDMVNTIFDEISAETAAFLEQGVQTAQPVWERRAFMRYVGQGWEIPVVLPARRYTEAEVPRET